MKVNSIQQDLTLKQGNLRLHSESPNIREKNYAGVYKNNRGYNADYCGSFTGKSEAATTVIKKNFLDKILASNWFGKFAKYSEEHNISASALIALVLAGVMRPATILALPGKKDKEDKIYAAGHSMASGIIGFLVSTAITSPFDESIKKIFDSRKFGSEKFKAMDAEIARLNAEKEAGKITKEAKATLKAMMKKREALSTLVKNIPDWVIGVPRAILTIALIPPILKYVFGVEKKKKPKPEQENNVNNTVNKMETPQMDFIEKPAFQQFKGGVK